MTPNADCGTGEHRWHKPTEGVVECMICGLDANEAILGMRADEVIELPPNGSSGTA